MAPQKELDASFKSSWIILSIKIQTGEYTSCLKIIFPYASDKSFSLFPQWKYKRFATRTNFQREFIFGYHGYRNPDRQTHTETNRKSYKWKLFFSVFQTFLHKNKRKEIKYFGWTQWLSCSENSPRQANRVDIERNWEAKKKLELKLNTFLAKFGQNL